MFGMKSYIINVGKSEDLTITIPQEIVAQLGIVEGTEARIKLLENNAIEVDFLTEDVELDLTEDELAWLSAEAHKKNVTLNEFVLNMLEDEVEGGYVGHGSLTSKVKL